MTPQQLARTECSNLNPDGSCLNSDWDEVSLATICHFKKAPPRCLVLENKSCTFFESVVFPVLKYISSHEKENAWAEAIDLYNERKDAENAERNRSGQDGLERERCLSTAGDQENHAPQPPHSSRSPDETLAKRDLRLSRG